MHVKESKTVLDSGFHAADSGFQSLSVELGFWIPSAIQCDSGFLSAVFWIQKPRIADSTSKNFPDSTNQILCLHEMRSRKALNSALHETRDFKMPRRRRQRERQKSNWLNKQNNNSARASRFFVHFFTVRINVLVQVPGSKSQFRYRSVVVVMFLLQLFSLL